MITQHKANLPTPIENILNMQNILIAIAATSILLVGCARPISIAPLKSAALGTPVTEAQVLVAVQHPNGIRLEKIKVADWNFPRNFVDPGEIDENGNYSVHREELLHEVFIYVLRHPEHGLYFIDAGFPKNREENYRFLLRWNVRKKTSKLTVHHTTADWLSQNTSEPLKGIFLTHLHFDHMQGVAELNSEIPLIVGPAEGTRRNIYNPVIAKPTRDALKNRS
ncbi:MAG: MBL fold metallo-hydrolase [Marinicaulis sp.]|nr:MBL fold metallo-hydrolase [Marinicaulis sp.]